MSEDFNTYSELEALLAVGLGANKGFWMIQPRDDEGQWIEMGADVLFRFRTSDGSLVVGTGRGVYVGPSGRPGYARVLVENPDPESGLKPGVYEFESRNLQQFKALLPEGMDGKGTGPRQDKFGKPVQTLADNQLPELKELLAGRSEPTEEDLRFAKGDLTPEEKEAEAAAREESPIANLPAGFEGENPEEVERLLREVGVEPNDFAPKTKTKKAADSSLSKMSDDELIDAARQEYLSNYDQKPRSDGKIGTPPLNKQFTDELARRGIPLFEIATPEHRALDDAFVGAYDEAGAPQIDALVSKANTKQVKAIEVSVGDVVVAPDGSENTVIEAKALSGGRVLIRVSTPSGQIRRDEVDAKTPLSVLSKKTGKPAKPPKPAKPATPAKPTKPATPATPDTPTTPTPPNKPPKPPKPPKPTKPPKVTIPPRPAPAANRVDNGGMIAPSSKSAEELRKKKINNLIDDEGNLVTVLNDKGKPRKIEDPNAIIDALLEENPNAKIKKDGTIVMERGEFTDTDGKKYIYEVGVQQTVGNQFMERYTLSDPETGEVRYDFYNADYKDSFYGLYGKTSGLTRTRDLILGREIPGNKGVDADGVPIDDELANYFGPTKSIAQRLKYMRKGKNVNGWRLVTPKENIVKYLIGRARELNKSDVAGKNYQSQFLNVRRSFVASVFEAIDLRDNELIKERLVQLLGRLPKNDESVKMLVDVLREQITERYKGTPRERELQTLPLNMEKVLKSARFDLRNRSEVPFVSEDGVTPVVSGTVVRFLSNEGDMAIGTVVKLNSKSGAKGGYKDTARVQFADGTIVDNLQTRNMLITEDEAPTDYQPWVRLEEKIRRRLPELGLTYEEYMRRKEEDPNFDPDEPEHAPLDAGSPYLGESGESGQEAESATPTAGAQAQELQPGDAFYDAEGGYIGTVIEVVEVPAEDGGEPGFAVKYIDVEGTEQVEVLDSGEFRGPK